MLSFTPRVVFCFGSFTIITQPTKKVITVAIAWEKKIMFILPIIIPIYPDKNLTTGKKPPSTDATADTGSIKTTATKTAETSLASLVPPVK